jgi:hypothetical protein
MKSLLLLVPDLFFETRIVDAAARLGARVVTMTVGQDPKAAVRDSKPSLVLLTFNRTGEAWQHLATAGREAGVPVIAFGSHMDVDAFRRAKELGCTEVMANSRLTAALPDLLSRYLGASK